MEDWRGENPERSSDGSLSRASEVTMLDSNYGLLEDVTVRLRMQMELFSIRFDDWKQVNLEEAYGFIFLECAACPHVLFERFPGDPLPIDDTGLLKLTDPLRAKTAYDRVDFYSFLSSLDDEVEEVYDNIWNGIRDECLLCCNKLLTKRISSVFGPIELNYAVFTKSVTTTLEVKLLDLKDEGILVGRSEIEVYGLVTAQTQMITDEKAKICMFKRDKDMCAIVKPGETIPLSRCLTVCPSKSGVVFHLSLYHPSNIGSGADDLIISQNVEVPASKKEWVLNPESNCACIQLKVTFTDWLGQLHKPY